MKLTQTLISILYLVALGYLGLYLYGLFMGAYSPGQMAGFSIVAAILGVVCAVHAIRVHRAMRDPKTHQELARKARALTERRGF